MKTTKNILTVSYALSFAVLLSCGQGGQNREAQVTDEQALAEASAEAVSYTVSTGESVVKWVGSKSVGGQHNGSLRLSSGSLSVEGGNITGGSFAIDITSLAVEDPPAESEDNAKLVAHLHSADFFDSSNFTEATFEITSVSPYVESSSTEGGDDAEGDAAAEDTEDAETSPAGEEEGGEDVAEASEVRGESVDSPTHNISGNLTLRGVTKNVTFPAQVSMEDGALTAEAKFSLNRTDFGVEYNNESLEGVAAEMIIKDYVDVHLQITAQVEAASEEEAATETQATTTDDDTDSSQ